MFLADPPAAAEPGPALGLRRVLAREFGGHSAAAHHPDLRVFLSDLVRPYGLEPDREALRTGRGHAYAELGEALVRELVGPKEPVDLLVLAFASPDVQPGRAAAVHLGEVCPGRPLGFALCDQGAAGVFTALRIAQAYARDGAVRRALVLVAEQAQSYYPLARPAPWPDGHRAVGLLCEATGSDPDLAVTDQVGVGLAQVPELLARAWRPGEALLLGPGLARAAAPAGSDPVRTDPGRPFTGLWSALADHHPGRRPVLLAEYADGLLCLARWQPAAETVRPFVLEAAE
ncbi:2-hydroxy-acid oxidase [Streptomyces tateyamensis]|uniref:2-hydroxy-acid oxidase n=1 Tax=Streptomyces tateyamensis TaxID=565073 RepID=UPI0015E8C088|nr:2-hydroxy-acid oxidase [Streptomyces tateyamensis]